MSHNRGKGFKIPEDRIKEVETMAGLGMPFRQMAAIFGVSEDTFCFHLKKNDAAQAAIERGQAISSHNSRQTAYNLANGYKRPMIGKDGKLVKDPETGEIEQEHIPPDPRMTMFWLKTRERFQETARLELTGKDGKPLAVTQLTKEQMDAEIERLEKLEKKLAGDEDDNE